MECSSHTCAQIWTLLAFFTPYLRADSVCAQVRTLSASFQPILARRFSLRASTNTLSLFSTYTCAQIQFARKYEHSQPLFNPYLRADSVCAQVRKFNEYISIITPEGCDNNRLDICPNDLDEWLHFSHNY
mgnify:CR=1 FL=1